MNLHRLQRNVHVVIVCPAGCAHLQAHPIEVLVLEPDTREPQLLGPFIATTPPTPN